MSIAQGRPDVLEPPGQHGLADHWQEFERTFLQGRMMPFELKRVLEKKQEQRERLAGRPLPEKLAPLDALRDRTLAIKAADPKGAKWAEGRKVDGEP